MCRASVEPRSSLPRGNGRAAWGAILPALLAVSGLLAVAGSGGCAGRKATPWSLLLITLDTTRADRLGCYGWERARTPNLDALAAEGALFENATAHAPLTLPAHASILTGTYPLVHGARGNGIYRLEEDRRTLAEILQAAGYRTAAVVASFVLDHRFGLAQGFDVYDDDASSMKAPTAFSDPFRDGLTVTRAALSVAAGLDPHKPRFLWVHYFDPHAPYTPPAEFRSLFPEDLSGRYDAEIAAMDYAIGLLLEGLDARGLLERTVTVVVGDHGEGFPGPHAEETHGIFLYQDTLRVPLLVHAPGMVRGPLRCGRLVRQVDVLPTVLDLLGIETPPPCQGISLRPLLEGAGRQRDPVSYGEATAPWDTQGWSPLYEVRDGDWKLIEAPRPELYHLSEDPREARNLAGDHPGEMERLRGILKGIRAEAGAGRVSPRAASAGERARLLKLGYVLPPGGGGGGAGGTGGLPIDLAGRTDPKDVIHVTHTTELARKDLEQGRIEEGIARLRGALGEDPGNFEAHRLLASHFANHGEPAAAERHIRAMLAVHPEDPVVLGMLGDVCFAQGRFEDALDEYRRAARLAPDEATNWGRLGNVQGELDRPEEAEQAYRKAISLDPDLPLANLSFGLFLVKRGRPGEAVPFLRKAVEASGLSPVRHRNANMMLVTALLGLRRYNDAVPWIERLIREQPGDPRVPEWRASLEKIRGRRKRGRGAGEGG